MCGANVNTNSHNTFRNQRYLWFSNIENRRFFVSLFYVIIIIDIVALVTSNNVLAFNFGPL